MSKPKKSRKVGVIIQQYLFGVISISFILLLVGVIAVQKIWQQVYSYSMISQYVVDVSEDVEDSFSELLSSWSDAFTRQIEENYEYIDDATLTDLVSMNHEVLSEVNIVDQNGIIIYSSVPEYVGWDMHQGPQSAEFLCLLEGQDYYEQTIRANDYDASTEMIYAGKAFSNRKGFVEIGISKENYKNYINESLAMSVKNRRVGFNGAMVICDKNHIIVGSTDDKYNGLKLDRPDILPEQEGELKTVTVKMFGKNSYIVSILTQGYYIIAGYPVDEAGFLGMIDKVLIFIMITIILVSIFFILNRLLNNNVVHEIESINGSLAKITDGNLEEKVDVNSSIEFEELSEGINKTVDRLKDMIDEAEKRIDMELEMARSIQRTSLPNCNEKFKHNEFFQLYASMDTAKTVGGDYYDFYMLPGDILVVTMADVSDKGIPAAMFMMRAKTLMKSLSEMGMSVEEMAVEANKGLWENNEGNMFVTAWIGFINIKTGLVRYVHAGHTCPILFGNSEPVFIKKKRQMLMGGMPDATYTGQEFTMKSGDCLFLYTDGVTEAERADHEQFGNDRILNLIAGMKDNFQNDDGEYFCEYVCKKAIEEVHAFSGDTPQSDDITVLCVQMK